MEQGDGNFYLTMYPKLRRWINQCVACQAQGYMPKMDEYTYPDVPIRNLRHYFPPLAVDEHGFCEQCQAALDMLSNSH